MGHKKRGSLSSPCVAVDGFQPIKSLASPPSLPKISIKIVEPILGTTAATHHWTQSTGQNNGKLDQFLLSQKNTFQLLSQHKSDFRIIVENVNEQPNIHFKNWKLLTFFIVLDMFGTVLAGERANINCSVRKMLPTCCIWDLFSISHQIGSRTEGIGGTRPREKEDEEISRSWKTNRRIIHEIIHLNVL